MANDVFTPHPRDIPDSRWYNRRLSWVLLLGILLGFLLCWGGWLHMPAFGHTPTFGSLHPWPLPALFWFVLLAVIVAWVITYFVGMLAAIAFSVVALLLLLLIPSGGYMTEKNFRNVTVARLDSLQRQSDRNHGWIDSAQHQLNRTDARSKSDHTEFERRLGDLEQRPAALSNQKTQGGQARRSSIPPWPKPGGYFPPAHISRGYTASPTPCTCPK